MLVKNGDESFEIMRSLFSTHIVQHLHAMLHEHAASDDFEAPFVLTFTNFKELRWTAPSAKVRWLSSATSHHQRAARELFIETAMKRRFLYWHETTMS